VAIVSADLLILPVQLLQIYEATLHSLNSDQKFLERWCKFVPKIVVLKGRFRTVCTVGVSERQICRRGGGVGAV
jgi:hypothetical protein